MLSSSPGPPIRAPLPRHTRCAVRCATKRSTMAKRPTHSITIAELPAGRRDPDEDMLQALVTAGALVALADGELAPVERGELLSFIDRQGFIPTISQQDAAAAIDNRVRQLEDRYGANVILETLRPLADLSLASVVMRTAERVAAADRKIHRGERAGIAGDHRLERLIDRLPRFLRSRVRWLRQPSLIWLRIPAGILLI